MTRDQQYAMASIAVAALMILGIIRWRTGAPSVRPRAGVFAAAASKANPALDSILADAEELTVSNDPFRLSNEASNTRFDPRNENGVSTPSAPPPALLRPMMTLKAIIGGPPWQAVVDGIPGQPPGTIVQAGARFDKLVARAVTRDSVIIQGPDTSWVLSFRRAP